MILDLCGGTGSWSAPYERAGYHVLIVDPVKNWTVQTFLFMLRSGKVLKEPVRGVIAAPPCTEFSSAGARHWATKDPALLDQAIEIVRACHDIVLHVKPKWWVLENPIGRIESCCPFLGKKIATYHPWEYGDTWIKQTCLWGEFIMPPKTVTERPSSSFDRTHRMSEQAGRARLRAMTSPHFADAFFRSNP